MPHALGVLLVEVREVCVVVGALGPSGVLLHLGQSELDIPDSPWPPAHVPLALGRLHLADALACVRKGAENIE